VRGGRKKAEKAVMAAAGVEMMKKVCLKCGKVGSSGKKNFVGCVYCGTTPYCSKVCQNAHWNVGLTSKEVSVGLIQC